MRFALSAALCLCTIAMASLAAAESHSLKRIPQVGIAIKYTMTAEFKANGGQGKINATLLEEVTDVDKAGNYTVQQTQIDAKGAFGGEDFDIPARTPITMTYAQNRMLMKIKGDLIDSNSYRVENMATLIDPGKPVDIGDEWSGEIKADKTQGTPAIKLEYKLVAEEKVADIPTLKINGTAQEADGATKASHKFTMWISKNDGALIQLESAWENAPFPGVSSPVSATIKITKAQP